MLARTKYVGKYIAAMLYLAGTMNLSQAETNQPSETYAEGVAAIVQNDRNTARQKALVDALNQASLSMGAHVISSEHINSTDASLRSQQIRPTRQVSKYSIVREWEYQAMYHVAISAEEALDESVIKETNNAHAVKKKVVFTRFDAINTVQLDDIRNVYSELPREISSRLDAEGGVVVSYTDGSIPRDSGAPQREVVMQVARDAGAQFLVSGLILDAGIGTGNGILGTLFGSKSRHFKIELSVHDGLTGVKLLSRNLEGEAQGDVSIGDDKLFGGGAFFETESGRALNKLIANATIDIRAALVCLPFSANVARVEGKNVYLDAGAISMLKVGDELALYTTDIHLPVVAASGSWLGMPERPAATVTLVKVQPLFSVGTLPEDASKLGVKTGSIARFEFSEKGLDSPTCLQ